MLNYATRLCIDSYLEHLGIDSYIQFSNMEAIRYEFHPGGYFQYDFHAAYVIMYYNH